MDRGYGKNRDNHRKDNNLPSNDAKNPRKLLYDNIINSEVQKNIDFNIKSQFVLPRGEGQTTTQYHGDNNYVPGTNNPFYIFLLENAIAQTTDKIRPGTHTSIPIVNYYNSGHLGYDYLLRKGDYFYIYNRKTFKSLYLQCDRDLLDTDTSIIITSTTISVNDNIISGSLIVPDFKKMTARVSNTPEFKRFDLTNSAYRALNSTPLTLLSGVSGKLHIPLSVTILLNHGGVGADEMTSADLYVGHNATSTIIGNYWASMDRAFYRARNDQYFQLSAGIYGAGSSTDFSRIPTKSTFNDAKGRDLKLYTTANFTSTSNTIKVFLYYKTITI